MNPRAWASPQRPDPVRFEPASAGGSLGPERWRPTALWEILARDRCPGPVFPTPAAPAAPAPPPREMERTCAFLPLPAELAPPAQALAAALGGDRASWGAVLGPLDGRLRALARRRIPLELRGRIEPEDLVQEAYLRILERCTEFEDRGRTSFLGWALRLFENIVADALRHHRRQRRSPEREAARVEGLELADRREGAACPLSQLLEREQSADVAQALAGLGGEERGLLEARFQGGLSYGRIAHERGWSETTTRRRLSELVQRLQVALG